MKRILLLTRPLCPPWDEGSKNFAYSLTKHSNGVEMHVLTCGKVLDLPPNVVQHAVYTSPKWDWLQKLRAYFFLAKEFFLKRGKEFDVLHSFFTPTALNVAALKICLWRTRIKTIQTVATLRDDLYSQKRLKKILHADLLVTYSDYAREKLQSLGFSNAKRIFPAINIVQYSPASKKMELLKKFNTRNDDFVINYAGEYLRLGDMDDVIAVFTELAAENGKFKLHLAVRVKNRRDAAKKKEITGRLKALGILDRVAMIDGGGYEMEDVYNLSDIAIFPARTLAGKFDIPLVLIEAMACGKPVIASDLPKLRHLLAGDIGIIVSAGDRKALKDKILFLYENSEERASLGKRGMMFVRENFDIEKVAQAYADVYKNI